MSENPANGPEASPRWVGRMAFLVGLLVLLVVVAVLFFGIGLMWRADGIDTFGRRIRLAIGLLIAYMVGAVLWTRRTLGKRTRT